MGMFDTISGSAKCECGGDIYYEAQTKSFECMLQSYKIGSFLEYSGTRFWEGYEEPCDCEKCGKKYEMSILTVDNIFVAVVTKEQSDLILEKVKNLDIATITVSKTEFLKDPIAYAARMEKMFSEDKTSLVIDTVDEILSSILQPNKEGEIERG